MDGRKRMKYLPEHAITIKLSMLLNILSGAL